MTRPLSGQQKRRLDLAAMGFISASTERSMPSLEKRGFVERYWHTDGGRRYRMWRVTEAGIAEAARNRAEAAEEFAS